MDRFRTWFARSTRWGSAAASLAGLLLLAAQGRAWCSWAGLAVFLGFVLSCFPEGGKSIALRSLPAGIAPFRFGLLVLFMRVWYWDGVDWEQRVEWLLLLIALLIWGRLAMQKRLLSRVLSGFAHLNPFKRGLTVFLLCAALFIAGGLIFNGLDVPLGGDEPHYLVIAQSLAEDGDFNVANQYYRRLYRKYLEVEELGIHGYFGDGGRQEIFSFHLPGTALTVTPLLWLVPPRAMVAAVRLLLALYAALMMLVVYLSAWRLMNSSRTALLVTLAMALTAPVYFYSFHFYPEAQVMLLLLSSLYLRYLSPRRERPWALVLSGLALGLLLFWGVKYASLLYLYGFGAVYGLVRRKNWRGALLFCAGPLLMQGLFWSYLYSAYGNFSPASVYQNELQKSQFWGVITREQTFQMRLEAFLNYFLDQRDGLLLYAPLYSLALAGFIRLCTLYRRYRRLFWLTLPALVYIGSYAFLTHRGGYCPQARPLMPVSWALMLLVLFLFRHSPLRGFKRTLAGSFLVYGLFITLYQLFNPYTLYQSTTRDVQFRPGLLFQRLGNGMIDLPSFLPSFIKTEGNFSWIPNLVFIFFLLSLTWLALSRRSRVPTRFALGSGIAAWVLLLVLFPRMPLYNPILIDREDVLPHRLFGASLYPRKADNRFFRVGEEERFPILLSPVVRMEELAVRFNNLGPSPVEVRVWNFDRSLSDGFRLVEREEKLLKWNDPVARTWRGMNMVQLYLAVRGQNPDLEIEVLPLGRRPSLF